MVMEKNDPSRKPDGQETPDSKRARVDDPSVQGIVEADVGITCYLRDVPGFKGTLKQRYTDFLVNEIDSSGQTVRLTDLGLADKRERRNERRQLDTAAKGDDLDISYEDTKRLETSLGSVGDIESIMQILKTKTKVKTSQAFNEKEQRTAIHQLIREIFKGKLDSCTNPDNTLTITVASRSANRSHHKLDKTQLGQVKQFLHFTLYKENKDTIEAGSLLAKFLRIPPKSIAYAGTKDRRGVTVQRMSVNKVAVERINGLNHVLRGLAIGGLSYADEPLRLGDLTGNEFFITIREVKSTSLDNVNQSLTSLRDHGFINYFGMQRFGTFSISTHHVGSLVLKGDWEAVVKQILAPQPLATPDSVEAREVWASTSDAARAFSLMPKKCTAEWAILSVLSHHPTSYLDAVMKIPRNLRIMYAHAYQSYIWNRLASKRVEMGHSVMEGDLVLETDSDNLPGPIPEDPDLDFAQEDLKKKSYQRARLVSAQEFMDNKYTIYDIVLPTPGFDVIYPSLSGMAEHYKIIMEADGLDPDSLKRNIKEFSLSGNYRHVFARPKSLSWAIRKYTEPTDQITLTDLDLLKRSNNDVKLLELERILPRDEGNIHAVVVRLQLGSSQYATMALREAMRGTTSRRGDMMDIKTSTDV